MRNLPGQGTCGQFSHQFPILSKFSPPTLSIEISDTIDLGHVEHFSFSPFSLVCLCDKGYEISRTVSYLSLIFSGNFP
jgi:hypothetical protein